MYQLRGVLKEVKETRQISEKFSLREFVLTDESTKYPQHIQLQATQDRCDLLDGLNIGEEVSVNFNLRGREWTNAEGEVKYFNSLDAWKIESIPSSEQFAPIAKTTIIEDLKEDDLPF